MRRAVLFVFAAFLVLGSLARAAKKDAPKPVPWSFKPLLSSGPPAVKNAQWPRKTVDRFLLAKMEGARVKPSPQAAPRELLRRLSFDLVGMPPSPEGAAWLGGSPIIQPTTG